jgi:hypothetical protein
VSSSVGRMAMGPSGVVHPHAQLQSALARRASGCRRRCWPLTRRVAGGLEPGGLQHAAVLARMPALRVLTDGMQNRIRLGSSLLVNYFVIWPASMIDPRVVYCSSGTTSDLVFDSDCQFKN